MQKQQDKSKVYFAGMYNIINILIRGLINTRKFSLKNFPKQQKPIFLHFTKVKMF